ncbi:hypothetical protein FQN57_002657 [Myotisia sp. PD_48]|nr:hypothetical protein FQN57_002657 [Myotisia sp. PD_48]
MSLEASGLARSSSPASSEASLPKPTCGPSNDAFKKDKNYRRYASNVERALSLFDTALQEWADYIAFLSRLLKALQTHPPSLNVVPNEELVAKRLAQCMNPLLPSGVHQKALEVYRFIFELLKSDGLARDLAIYLPGIAPTLTFASLSVRPLFLSLIRNHVLPLSPAALRPALKSVILALLPGLEEETSEDFETTLDLVDRFRQVFSSTTDDIEDSSSAEGSQYFWQCLFLSSITNPSRRLGILAYLNRHLPKLGPSTPHGILPEDILDGGARGVGLSGVIESIISPEPGLLIRCFATGLADDQLLVQRNFLDLLVTHLPLHSQVLQKYISPRDLQLLVGAAAGVVIRRDMSLNRRLWAWLLGPGPEERNNADIGQQSFSEGNADISIVDNDNEKSHYFEQHGLKPLIHSIKSTLAKESQTPQQRMKPFRISLSLLDRWEVGGLVAPEVFLPIIRSVQRYKRTSSTKANFDEVFRSASAFFDGVESSLIFSELTTLILSKPIGPTGSSSRLVEDLPLVHFILSHFNTKEEEMLMIHIPLLILSLLLKMKTLCSEEFVSPTLMKHAMDEVMAIISLLLQFVPERAFTTKPEADQEADDSDSDSPCLNMKSDVMISKILDFYSRSKDTLELPEPPFTAGEITYLISHETHSITLLSLEADAQAPFLKERMNLLVSLLNKIPQSQILQSGELYEAMDRKISLANDEHKVLSMSMVTAIVSGMTSLYSAKNANQYITYDQLCEMIPSVVHQLWEFLAPTHLRFHVEATGSLWLLHSLTWREHLIEASITSLMLEPSANFPTHQITPQQAERFFVFWNHSHHSNIDSFVSRTTNDSLPSSRLFYRAALLSRPAFIVLDLLTAGPEDSSITVKEWLQDPSYIYNLFHIILFKFHELDFLSETTLEESGEFRKILLLQDANQCSYMLRVVINTISSLTPNGWGMVSSNVITLPRTAHFSSGAGEDDTEDPTILNAVANLSIHVLSTVQRFDHLDAEQKQVQKEGLNLLFLLLTKPGAEKLVDVDTFLLTSLSSALDEGKVDSQKCIIRALIPALKNRYAREMSGKTIIVPPINQRKNSIEALTNRFSLSTERIEKISDFAAPQPPPKLLDCLLKGISSTSSRPIIDKWIHLLTECLPLYYPTIFQVILTLVECFSKEIKSSFNELQGMFLNSDEELNNKPENTTIALLSGLENCIATAHDRLLLEESTSTSDKASDQPQGFFGNMMSGVFATEGAQSQASASTNTRLTVLLCFQNAVRLCCSIWTWGSGGRNKMQRENESVASFQYTSLRMRNRARRLLEHLFSAEALECLETLIQLWRMSIIQDDPAKSRAIFSLLHSLDGSRPKVTVPAIFNAIYSRNNPTALDPSRKSTLASELSESDLAAFLVMYAKSLDDDILDEIWSDCTTFLRDVLANPFPHRQILPRLLEFAIILGTKMENTTFGDDRRARRDLGDLLQRLLQAILSSKPMSLAHEPAAFSKTTGDVDHSSTTLSIQQKIGPGDIITILSSALPALMSTLGETDRIASVMASISTNIISPLFHSRLFPGSVDPGALDLLQQMSKISSAAKYWKKDITDAFNDSRFFGFNLDIVKRQWLDLLHRWVLTDTSRLSELLTRLSPPTSAGIMFGVGAGTARLEADRKAQLNLRRIALLIVASDEDHFSSELSELQQKLEDLLAATHVSSPSSVTRSEIYMVLRALVLKTTSVHLAPFWPMLNAELRDVISAVMPGQPTESYSPYSLLQASKLLETLLLISPDDFQLQEWLFVTDTIDVVYPPHRWEPSALADEVSRALGTGPSMAEQSSTRQEMNGYDDSAGTGGFKRSWLTSDLSRETNKDEIVEVLLRPFFERLSIHAFETTYQLAVPDMEACKHDLMADLFNEFTIAS